MQGLPPTLGCASSLSGKDHYRIWSSWFGHNLVPLSQPALRQCQFWKACYMMA